MKKLLILCLLFFVLCIQPIHVTERHPDSDSDSGGQGSTDIGGDTCTDSVGDGSEY